jgi:hypothetical protein
LIFKTIANIQNREVHNDTYFKDWYETFKGLCNGSKLIVTHLRNHVIEAYILIKTM